MDTRWWRDAVIYQVYPRSFADSDGDGMGDLPGITSRLDHLRDLGVDAVWISPFYPSPQKDAGYDVSDYCGVDDLFGTLEDADALVKRAHELGLRVIVDLVPNHTSDEHPWFRRALAAAPGSPERDWYMFRDADPAHPDVPPNNWESNFGGPAWSTVDDAPDAQWYLHLFDSSQPDLNWENPEVRDAFLDILRFWLDRDVDGFRVDVAHGMVKAPGLPDVEPGSHQSDAMAEEATPYWDQDGVHEIYRSWRDLLDSYPGERIMVAEAWVQPVDRIARYVRPGEHHQAFNFSFLDAQWDADVLRETIAESYRVTSQVDAPTTWVLSNHDVIRHATRLALPPEHFATQLGPSVPAPDPVLGLRRARAATTLMLALPGSAYIYQGEELGLPEVLDLPDEARQDPTFRRTAGERLGRDGCRVPVPWSADDPGFGFSPADSAPPWLPQPRSFGGLAVDVQQGDPSSTLELYRGLLAARRERGLGRGSLAPVEAGQDVLAFDVSASAGTTRVVLNFGARPWAVPEGYRTLLSSAPGVEQQMGSVPGDCAAWLAPIG
ncbi:MAG: glycoside hydrolase family 13 protein [Mycobacteriaceae bacterium]|uniref:glycoside hydrolase family 13 protein n=1 Tax=Corynebacterium sp. TaxID=1720 RepID=UPI003F981FDA